MIADVRDKLNYNYKKTSQKIKETSVSAERYGTPQVLFDSPERNLKTLEDLISIIQALKGDRKYDLVDSYSNENVIMKVEVRAQNLIREIKDKKLSLVELDPGFLKKARDILEIYDRILASK
jgi:16S rRNA C1402 (ribose-2'-O) methylase RsmI